MNILTFDIEDWFHILDNPATKGINQWASFESRLAANLDKILNIIQQQNTRATFFCVGWNAEKHPNEIRKIVEAGYDIGSHTHLHQLVYEQSPSEFEEEVKKSIYTLENITGRKVVSFRAPGFSITSETLWAFEILLKYGIEIDSSVFPASRAHGGFDKFGSAEPIWIEYNGMKIKEFPINTCRIFGKPIIFSGGGYFRVLPYSIIRGMTQKSPYIMTYFHPRDFDRAQPMAPGLSLSRKFKSYYG
ncbi:MAG TPA: polysaccharide deacetylase family protein, partial [Flavobacterium sp.]|nr:polysaccharide deacetylase family protein [Flavobacterium sp.]